MFAAGRILRQNRRLSSLPASSLVGAPTKPARRKENRKFRCYLPFMWSALAMSVFGITIIATGTAMCVAGWYLGHFADDAVRQEVAVESGNASGGLPHAEEQALVGISADMPPARGLAYAGPVVMSFGCFAVVFACVVVCETRDRVLETMDERVRRGLPAKPPGGIDADFYSLVVEFRKRRVEKQRRRKLLRRDDVQPEDDIPADPSQPTPSTTDFLTPTTVNDFVDGREEDIEQSILGRRQPTFRLEKYDQDTETDDCVTRWCSSPGFPDKYNSTSLDMEMRAMEMLAEAPPQSPPGGMLSGIATSSTHTTANNLSPLWKPATASKCPRSCYSADGDAVHGETLRQSVAPPINLSSSSVAENFPHLVTSSQVPFPLLAPISCMAQTATPPYIGLEVGHQSSSSSTYLVHTASVHAIADRSPDVIPRPDITSFEFPTPITSDVYGTGNSVTDTDVAVWLSGDVVRSLRDATSDLSPRNNTMNDNSTACEYVEPLKKRREEDMCGSGSVTKPATENVIDVTSPIYDISSSMADIACQAKRYRDTSHAEFQQACPGEWSTVGDSTIEEPGLEWSSTSVDDEGPSRKRPRGSKSHSVRQACARQAAASNSRPLSLSETHFESPAGEGPHPSSSPFSPVTPYLISGTGAAEPGTAASRPAATPAWRIFQCPGSWRRRSNGGVRHPLAVRRRRRRQSRVDEDTRGGGSGHVSTSQDLQLLPTDENSCSWSAAPHSADELDNFRCPRSAVEEDVDQLTDDSPGRTNDGTDNSRLVWLRRRTSTAVSPQRDTGAPFQSAV